jgi:hypothetical protein
MTTTETVTVKGAAAYFDYFVDTLAPNAVRRPILDGQDVVLTEQALRILSDDLDGESDGYVDAEGMWLGGECYRIVR